MSLDEQMEPFRVDAHGHHDRLVGDRPFCVMDVSAVQYVMGSFCLSHTKKKNKHQKHINVFTSNSVPESEWNAVQFHSAFVRSYGPNRASNIMLVLCGLFVCFLILLSRLYFESNTGSSAWNGLLATPDGSSNGRC